MSLIVSALILLVLSYLAGIVSGSRISESINDKWMEFLVLFPAITILKIPMRPIDGWMIGFVIEKLDNSDISVFIPGSPDTMSGNLVIFKENEVKKSNLTQEEALEILRRTGIGFKSIS